LDRAKKKTKKNEERKNIRQQKIQICTIRGIYGYMMENLLINPQKQMSFTTEISLKYFAEILISD